MAEILIKIKIEGNSNALAFVERTQPYLSKTLKEIRQDIVSEVGELLPQNFKFVRTGIPVNAIQEEKLHLQKCIGEEENGKVPCGWRLIHIFELQSLVVLDTTNMRLPEVTITDASSKKCKVSLLSREVIFK